MRITESQLRSIIRREVRSLLRESEEESSAERRFFSTPPPGSRLSDEFRAGTAEQAFEIKKLAEEDPEIREAMQDFIHAVEADVRVKESRKKLEKMLKNVGSEDLMSVFDKAAKNHGEMIGQMDPLMYGVHSSPEDKVPSKPSTGPGYYGSTKLRRAR